MSKVRLVNMDNPDDPGVEVEMPPVGYWIDGKFYRGVIGTDPPICKIESWTVGKVDDSSTQGDGIDKKGG